MIQTDRDAGFVLKLDRLKKIRQKKRRKHMKITEKMNPSVRFFVYPKTFFTTTNDGYSQKAFFIISKTNLADLKPLILFFNSFCQWMNSLTIHFACKGLLPLN